MRQRFALAALAIGTLAFSTAWAGDFSADAAPSGAHFANGASAPSCTVNSNLTVSCTGTVISGVGNLDANVTVNTSYSGVVTCTNNGGNTVEVKTQSTSSSVLPDPVTSVKNGTMTVRAVTFGGTSGLIASAECPNGKWTKTLASATLLSYSYTLTFEGFSQPAITITGP